MGCRVAVADRNSTRGLIAGARTPGQSRSQSGVVNAGLNTFFTCATMVIPSNDFFLGRDNSADFQLFDDAGDLLINRITPTSSQLWYAGSTSCSIAATAFLVSGVNAVRTPQNGRVSFNFAELMRFNGQETAAGFVFNSGLAAGPAIDRIDFAVSVLAEPSTMVLLVTGLMMLGIAVRTRNAGARPSRQTPLMSHTCAAGMAPSAPS